MNTKTFGNRIKNIRKTKNMSVEQLADKADISVDHLRAIESGRRLPSLTVCLKIINIFNISSDELLKGNVKQASAFLVNDITRKMINLSVEQLNLLDAVCTAMIEEFKKSDNK